MVICYGTNWKLIQIANICDENIELSWCRKMEMYNPLYVIQIITSNRDWDAVLVEGPYVLWSVSYGP